MSKRQLVPFAIGALAVMAGIAWVFYIQRGAHIEPKGAILKVRTQPMDESSSVAVVDFRIANTSDYTFIVRQVDVSLEEKSGQIAKGTPVSEMDAKRLFQYYPLLGQKYNDTLLMRDKIAPHQSMDRMVAARFEIPEAQLEARKNLKVRVEDVDGPVGEISEK